MHHTQTAVQKVLNLPELVTEIVNYLVDCGRFPCDFCKRLLVPIALTSKAFATPVFDRLWADLGSLAPLLNLLPSALHSVDATGGRGKIYDLRAPISDADWDTFVYYSRFVRHLRIARFERLSKAAFDALLARAKGNPLLPKLQRLQVDAQEQFIEYIYQLIPASPTFALSLNPWFDAGWRQEESLGWYVDTVLDKIYTQAPMMKKLTLSMNDAEEVPVSCVRPLARFSSLQALTLYIPIASSGLLDACAQLPHLAALEMYLPVVGYWYETKPGSGDHAYISAAVAHHANAFSELQRLTIRASPWYVADILNGIRSAPLRALKVTTGHDIAAWKCFTNTISSNFNALEDVFMSLQAPIDDHSVQWTFWDYFGLLTGVRSLRHVRLAAFETELCVTDDDVRGMASAWPLVETLMLEVAWKRTTRAPSIESLQRLVDRCPALRVLELPCPEPKLPAPKEVACLPHRRAPSGSLVRELWFTGERWTGEDGEKSMEHVRRLFPQLAEKGLRFGVSHSMASLCRGGTVTHINYYRPLSLMSRFPIR